MRAVSSAVLLALAATDVSSREPMLDLARSAPEIRTLREAAGVALESGDLAAAERSLRAAEKLSAESPMVAYDIACVLALAGRRAEALATLREAVARGWLQPDWAAADPDLGSLRDDPAWPALLGSMKPSHGEAWPRPAVVESVSAAQCDERSARWAEALEETQDLLGPDRLQREWRELRAWRAACTEASADPALGTERRRLLALRTMTAEGLEHLDAATLAEIERRAEELHACPSLRASAEDDAELRLTRATASWLRRLQDADSDAVAAVSKDFRDELALLLAMHPEGPSSLAALLRLTGVMHEDLPAAQHLRERMAKAAGGQDVADRMLRRDLLARSVHWRSVALPALSLRDTAGRAHVLTAQAPRAKLVTAWATWCWPCVQHLPELARIQKDLGDRVELLGIALDAVGDLDDAAFEQFRLEHGVTWPQVRDERQAVRPSKALDVMDVPLTLLVVGDRVVATDHELATKDGHFANLVSFLDAAEPSSRALGCP